MKLTETERAKLEEAFRDLVIKNSITECPRCNASLETVAVEFEKKCVNIVEKLLNGSHSSSFA